MDDFVSFWCDHSDWSWECSSSAEVTQWGDTITDYGLDAHGNGYSFACDYEEDAGYWFRPDGSQFLDIYTDNVINTVRLLRWR